MANLHVEEARFVAWIAKGVRREVNRLARKKKRQEENELLLLNHWLSEEKKDVEFQEIIPSTTDVYNQVEKKIVSQVFRSLLTETQQAVMIAIYMNGATEQEVAKEMGISQQAVNRIKSRAIKKLKQYLFDPMGEENKHTSELK